MARPCRCRRVCHKPGIRYFKPAGVPLADLEDVVLTLDELESLRLADLDGRYQEEAARGMGISRPTFGRIVEGARRKVAEALVQGKALRIEGGAVVMKEAETPGKAGRGSRGPRCGACGCGAKRREHRTRGGTQ